MQVQFSMVNVNVDLLWYSSSGFKIQLGNDSYKTIQTFKNHKHSIRILFKIYITILTASG